MSHFSVLVIGDNIEEQLAPFQENNMDDCHKEYLEFKDKTEENYTIDEARKDYHNQPILIAFKKTNSGWGDSVEDYLCSREEYILRAENSAVSTFAVIKDGKWYEKGDMGWWGCVSDEKDQNVWNKEFTKLIDSVLDDTLLTVVDCHI